MQSTLTGTVHGRTIELERDTSLPDGARVRISLEPVELSSQSGQAQAAILESAGAWSDADDAEFDRWPESTNQSRDRLRLGLAALRQLCDEQPIHSGGLRFTREELHERR